MGQGGEGRAKRRLEEGEATGRAWAGEVLEGDADKQG